MTRMRYGLTGLVMLLGLLAAGVVLAANVIVSEGDVVRQPENTAPTNSWVLYTRTVTSYGNFVTGPEGPPLGAGSLEMQTPGGSDKVYLFNYQHVGTRLADIEAIGYSTFRSSVSTATAVQVSSINIEVDSNGSGTGGYTVLVFEPVYNSSQGAVVPDQWQTWDAYLGGNAVWWSSRAIPGVCAFSCFVSWDTILANNPDAVIVGGFGINQGSGNGGLVAAVDALTLNSTTYDFEPQGQAMSRDACKDGGWQTLTRADHSPFTNQGDCVSYVNTGK